MSDPDVERALEYVNNSPPGEEIPIADLFVEARLARIAIIDIGEAKPEGRKRAVFAHLLGLRLYDAPANQFHTATRCSGAGLGLLFAFWACSSMILSRAWRSALSWMI